MIDDDIREALNVTPSPEFLARVRGRIANEPAPTVWRWSWTLAGAGALAAAVMVAAALWRPAPRELPRPDAVRASAPAEHAAGKPRDTTEPAISLGTTSTPRSTEGFRPQTMAADRLKGSRSAVAALPDSVASEVVLDPAETRALRRLIAGVRDGQVDLRAAQNSVSPAPMELSPITDIVIAPITIEPIAPPTGAEGARP